MDSLDHGRKARDDLILKYTNFAKWVARKEHKKYPYSIDVEDIEQEAMVGLIKALDSFNNQGKSLLSYIKLIVQRRISTLYARMQCMVSGYDRNKYGLFKKAMYETKGNLNIEKLKAKYGITKFGAEALISQYRNSYTVSTSASMYQYSDVTILDVTDLGGYSDPSELCGRIDMINYVRTLVKQLPFRWRKIVYMRFYEEMSLQEIADYDSVTPQNIHQQLKIIYRNLKPKLEKDYGESSTEEFYIMLDSPDSTF